MRRNPTRSRRLASCGWRLVSSTLTLLLVPAVCCALGNGKLQIHHIDVGQGDGALLISPGGQTVLFDDGTYTNCSNIKAYLQGLGVSVVDYHFASHYHADHIGCIDDLASVGITIGTAGWDRSYSYSSASYDSYVATLGTKRRTIVKGQVITLDSLSATPVTITCIDLNGAGVYPVNGGDENAVSVVLKVTYGAFDEEIGGDLTGSTTQGNDVETTVGPEVGDVEVYKAHHHGSKYSSNDNWLAAVTPEVAVISVGDGNTYGHPTVEALTRLHNHGIKTYWTETGAGVAPDPTWDKVGGTIVIQAMPGASDSFTVSGTGFTDTYVNGGGPPPPPPSILTETLPASAITMLNGTVTGGSAASLAADDGARLSVASVKSGRHWTDWYGSVVLGHPPTKLTVTYNGSYSASRTQTLSLWNFSTSAWTQVDQATVGTTDVTRAYVTTSPAAYVSASREVRLRVMGSRTTGAYTCYGDLMTFTYDYEQGTTPGGRSSASPPLADALRPALPDGHEDTEIAVDSPVLTILGNPARGAVRLRVTLAREAPVRLDVFDTAGRCVGGIAPATVTAGTHEISWDGRRAGAAEVPPGLYVARLTAGTERATIRFVLLGP